MPCALTAALTNMIFLQPDIAHVLEISHNAMGNYHYQNLAARKWAGRAGQGGSEGQGSSMGWGRGAEWHRKGQDGMGWHEEGQHGMRRGGQSRVGGTRQSKKGWGGQGQGGAGRVECMEKEEKGRHEAGRRTA